MLQIEILALFRCFRLFPASSDNLWGHAMVMLRLSELGLSESVGNGTQVSPCGLFGF